MIYNTLSKLTGKTIQNPKDIILRGFTGSNDSSTTGVLLNVANVYSISEGTVIDIGKDFEGLYVVTVMYQPNKLFRYCLLSKVSVSVNDYIIPTDMIGVAYRSQLRFEYCTLEESNYIVRIGTNTFYKHDPIAYLMDGIDLYMSIEAISKYLDSNTSTEITSKSATYKLNNIMSGVDA
jgi:hypothetical protein